MAQHQIVGKDIANPVGTILSLALMFKYSLKREDTHNSVYKAVFSNIKEGVLTFNLNESKYYSTNKFTEYVIKKNRKKIL